MMVQETCSESSWWNSSAESEMAIGFGMKTSITSKSSQNGLNINIKLEKKYVSNFMRMINFFGCVS